jgi:hypothetical protein
MITGGPGPMLRSATSSSAPEPYMMRWPEDVITVRYHSFLVFGRRRGLMYRVAGQYP